MAWILKLFLFGLYLFLVFNYVIFYPIGDSSSNSNIQNEADDWVELSESNVVSDEKAALLLEFERKRRARQLHVPTEDKEVTQ